jgi:hypothetical protein
MRADQEQGHVQAEIGELVQAAKSIRAAEELNRMTDAIRIGAKEAMVGRIELVKNTTMEPPVVLPHIAPDAA